MDENAAFPNLSYFWFYKAFDEGNLNKLPVYKTEVWIMISMAGKLGHSGYSVALVHPVSIFKTSIVSLDQHAGNILVKKCCR